MRLTQLAEIPPSPISFEIPHTPFHSHPIKTGKKHFWKPTKNREMKHFNRYLTINPFIDVSQEYQMMLFIERLSISLGYVQAHVDHPLYCHKKSPVRSKFDGTTVGDTIAQCFSSHVPPSIRHNLYVLESVDFPIGG